MAPKPDLSEFFKLSRPKKRPCVVGHALGQLEGAAREQLEAALGTDPGIITHSAVRQWLAGRGYDASVSALVNHRVNRTCTCGDE